MSRIIRLGKHLQNSLKDALLPFDLEIWEYEILSALRREGEPFVLSPTELGRGVLLTSGAITNRINRLEERGLVERLRERDDRRGVAVRLTAEGKRVVDEVLGPRFAIAENLLSHLTPNERIKLENLLRKLLLESPGEADVPLRRVRHSESAA